MSPIPAPRPLTAVRGPRTATPLLRTAAVGLLLAWLAVVVLPGAALADQPGADPAEPVAEDAPPATGTDAEEPGDDASPEADADTPASEDPSLDDEPGDQMSTQVCDEPLLRVAPGSVSGEGRAVAIVAQVMDHDIAGWERISWRVDEDTELTAVTIVRADGNQTLTDELDAGTATAVLELVFCGRYLGVDEAPAPDRSADDATADDDAAAGADDAGAAQPSDEPAPAGASEPAPASAATGTTDDDRDPPASAEPRAATTDEPADEPTAAGAPATTPPATGTPQDEVEVLGVQVSAPATSGLPGWVQGLGSLALLAVAGAGALLLLRARTAGQHA